MTWLAQLVFHPSVAPTFIKMCFKLKSVMQNLKEHSILEFKEARDSQEVLSRIMLQSTRDRVVLHHGTGLVTGFDQENGYTCSLEWWKAVLPYSNNVDLKNHSECLIGKQVTRIANIKKLDRALPNSDIF